MKAEIIQCLNMKHTRPLFIFTITLSSLRHYS